MEPFQSYPSFFKQYLQALTTFQIIRGLDAPGTISYLRYVFRNANSVVNK